MLSPREVSTDSRGSEVSFGRRYPKAGTSSEKLGLSGSRHISGCHGNPGHTGVKGLLGALQLNIRVLASDQGSPGKPTRGGSNQHRCRDPQERNIRTKSREAVVGSDLLSRYPGDISFLSATSIKLGSNTILASPILPKQHTRRTGVSGLHKEKNVPWML